MKLKNVDGLVSDAEGRKLAELAGQVSPGEEIVEIGSYTGKSTCYMAAAALPSLRVWAIDLWDLKLPNAKPGRRNKHKYKVAFNSSEAFEIFRQRTSALNVEWIRAESAQAAKLWNRRIGLLFIDGAHDRKSVAEDYQLWSPWVVNGGWLAMHDATPGSKVQEVIDEVIKPSGLWTEWSQTQRLAVARRV